MAISKVAVVGGTGNLGPAIVNGLLNGGFEVTVLSRSSSHQLDPRVKVQVADYNSLDSLTTALSGQDAVVNTLGVGVVPGEVHLRVLEAAHAAKVQRYIPSEFGSDTANPLTAKLPVFGVKVAVIKKLEEIAAQDSTFSYTSIITGPFFDWGIEKTFLINLSGSSTSIYDGGDVPVSSTTLAGIGRAVAGTLQKAEETKNRHVYTANVQFTQNQVLQWSGKSDQIEKIPVKTEDLEAKAYEAIKQPTPDPHTFAKNLILRAIFGGKFGGHFAKTDNELLGLKELSESEIVDIVKKYV
ncbi:oxidoreductase CipA [Penicillium citrinum]|uniref:Oxidoreductase CipA n=2 Tax=Penicillium TaxID=5073 RepID=A0A9W9NWT5_PENCI|nr:oxidoreductase CipA [Penicillium citrinum]KAJ5227626.1 oxidoreductase CipA [Penicillium citrinum]KAJ5567896.1 oxidoreductase CipA [Penicillium hetheringtonii]